MRNPSPLRGVPVLFVTLCALSAVVWADSVVSADEVFTPEHVARLRAVGSAEISPDGRHIAYTLRVQRKLFEEESGSSWSELHVVSPQGDSRPFITGEVSIGSIGWTPDSKGISFLAKRGKDKTRSLYIIAVDGGEARRVFAHETDITSYSWSPDGKRFAFLASEKLADDVKSLKDKGFNQEIYEEDFLRTGVHIASVDGGEKARALDLPGSPSELHWAPVGSRLAVALAPTPLVDDHYMKRKLHVVDADSGKVVARFDNPGKLGSVAWSPDATTLAFVSAEDLHDPSAGRLMVAPAAGGPMVDLIPNYEGEVFSIAWRDVDTIVYLADEGVTTRFAQIRKDGSGAETHVAPGERVLDGLRVSRAAQRAVFRGESARHPPEVLTIAEGEEDLRRLTDSNPWLADMRFARQEIVSYKARDGLRLEGVLVRPLDENEGQRYPLILCVHGGPESHETNGWKTYYSRPGQVAAARGFAVFYPNYRGSTGRGVEFSKLGQADYGGKEFDDLVDAADHFIATGLADAKKIGVTGGSYGGFASAWCATKHSERFAASVMFVGISNQISKSGTTDIPNEMFLVHARRKLYDSWQFFLERSPIYHVKNAKTPILILHGKSDTRVHPAQSMELYRHLKILGQAPVRLVFYPGEGHGNRKSAARYDYNLRMLRWFEHYLKGPAGDPPAYRLDYGKAKGEEKEGGENKAAAEAKTGARATRL